MTQGEERKKEEGIEKRKEGSEENGYKEHKEGEERVEGCKMLFWNVAGLRTKVIENF